jgi:hypothetical protein
MMKSIRIIQNKMPSMYRIVYRIARPRAGPRGRREVSVVLAQDRDRFAREPAHHYPAGPHRLSQPVLRITRHTTLFRGSAWCPISSILFAEPREGA